MVLKVPCGLAVGHGDALQVLGQKRCINHVECLFVICCGVGHVSVKASLQNVWGMNDRGGLSTNTCAYLPAVLFNALLSEPLPCCGPAAASAPAHVVGSLLSCAEAGLPAAVFSPAHALLVAVGEHVWGCSRCAGAGATRAFRNQRTLGIESQHAQHVATVVCCPLLAHPRVVPAAASALCVALLCIGRDKAESVTSGRAGHCG